MLVSSSWPMGLNTESTGSSREQEHRRGADPRMPRGCLTLLRARPADSGVQQQQHLTSIEQSRDETPAVPSFSNEELGVYLIQLRLIRRGQRQSQESTAGLQATEWPEQEDLVASLGPNLETLAAFK